MKNFSFCRYFEEFTRILIDRSFGMIEAPPVESNEVSDGIYFVSGNLLYPEICLVSDYNQVPVQLDFVLEEKIVWNQSASAF